MCIHGLGRTCVHVMHSDKPDRNKQQKKFMAERRTEVTSLKNLNLRQWENSKLRENRCDTTAK